MGTGFLCRNGRTWKQSSPISAGLGCIALDGCVKMKINASLPHTSRAFTYLTYLTYWGNQAEPLNNVLKYLALSYL